MAKSGVCLNCPDRFINLETGETCHASCERYAEARKELDKFNEQQRAERRRRIDIIGYERDKALRLSDPKELRRKHRKGEKK